MWACCPRAYHHARLNDGCAWQSCGYRRCPSRMCFAYSRLAVVPDRYPPRITGAQLVPLWKMLPAPTLAITATGPLRGPVFFVTPKQSNARPGGASTGYSAGRHPRSLMMRECTRRTSVSVCRFAANCRDCIATHAVPTSTELSPRRPPTMSLYSHARVAYWRCVANAFTQKS